jgi:hypothetical protein
MWATRTLIATPAPTNTLKKKNREYTRIAPNTLNRTHIVEHTAGAEYTEQKIQKRTHRTQHTAHSTPHHNNTTRCFMSRIGSDRMALDRPCFAVIIDRLDWIGSALPYHLTRRDKTRTARRSTKHCTVLYSSSPP